MMMEVAITHSSTACVLLELGPLPVAPRGSRRLSAAELAIAMPKALSKYDRHESQGIVPAAGQSGTTLQAEFQVEPLRLLHQAAVDAQDCGDDISQFAVELANFHSAGIILSTLRRLVRLRFARHLVEISRSHARKRTFRESESLAFSEKSCFVLTPTGIALARREVRGPVTNRSPSANQFDRMSALQKPVWHAARRELSLGAVTVKRFRIRASNQEQILAAFEEEGWPMRIDDPLPPRGTQNSARRLHDVINKLNRHQVNRLLRFRGDGSGRGVCWEPLERHPGGT